MGFLRGSGTQDFHRRDRGGRREESRERVFQNSSFSFSASSAVKTLQKTLLALFSAFSASSAVKTLLPLIGEIDFAFSRATLTHHEGMNR